MRIVLQHPHRQGEISGVVTFVEAAARALQSIGHEVRILPTAQVSRREALTDGCWADVIHLNSTHPWLTLQARLQGKRLINSFHFPFWGTWKVTSADRSLGFAGCFFKTVGVFWSHGHDWRWTGKYARYFFTSVLRMVLRLVCTLLAHRRIAPTRFIAADACLPVGIDVVPYPFDLAEVAHFTPASDERGQTFCYVGRMTPQKGPDLLLEAADLLLRRGIEVGVCLVGDGDQLPALKEQAERAGMGKRFRSMGKLPRSEALQEMVNSVAVVVPSRWDDPSPFTVLEAAALGRAVIGSDRGGIPEITGPGLIFSPDSVSELADHMERLVKVPGEAERIGAECQAFVRKRSDPLHIGKELVRLYENG